MEVWEQQEGEPDEAFTRFEYYLFLGPTRSLEAAYYWYLNSGEIKTFEKGIVVASKSVKKRRVPGQWYEDSSIYQWSFRCNKWDINNLSVAGRVVISDFYKMLAEITKQHLEEIKKGKLVPRSYGEMIEGLTLLGTFVSPEAVAAWALDSGNKPTNVAPTATPENVSSIDARRSQQKRA